MIFVKEFHLIAKIACKIIHLYSAPGINLRRLYEEQSTGCRSGNKMAAIELCNQFGSITRVKHDFYLLCFMVEMETTEAIRSDRSPHRLTFASLWIIHGKTWIQA